MDGNSARLCRRGDVRRSGGWYFDGASCRCATRYSHAPGDHGFSVGFRVARDER